MYESDICGFRATSLNRVFFYDREAISTLMKSVSLPWKILIMVNKICEHYEITNGEIELAYVGLSALGKVFSYVSILCINDSN
jgi:hypothetical protein